MSRGSSSGRKRGFSIVEALVAAVLLAVGIAGLMGSLGSIARAYARIDERDTIHRLAREKMDEVLALGDAATPQNGDFQEEGVEGFSWETNVETSSRDGLLLLVLRVSADATGDAVELSRLLQEPPAAETEAP